MYLENYNLIFKKYNIFPLKLPNKNYACECPGVYFISENTIEGESICYIGSSILLKMRLNSHSVVRHLKNEGTFNSIYVIASLEYKELEPFLINIIQPRINKNSK